MQYTVYSTGRELTSALVVRKPYDSYRDSSTMPPLEMEVLGRTTLRTHTSPHAAEADLNGSTMAKQEGFPRSRLHSRLLCKVAYNNPYAVGPMLACPGVSPFIRLGCMAQPSILR